MKLLSEKDVVYYRYPLIGLLQACQNGEWYYTHHFYNNSCFKNNGSFLRKCLRTLEIKGYLLNRNTGFNTHQWKITEKAIQYLANYDKFNPVKI